MTLPASLGGLPPALALAIAGALLALLAWLGWRKPTWLFLLALAALAIRPQLLWGGPEVGWRWGLHQTLIVFALATNALHFGLRRTVNWPILALLAVFALSSAFGNLHPKLTLPLMLESLALLSLPFAFTQVVLEPGSRKVVALCIALTPMLSVALGAVLQAFGIRPVFMHEWSGAYRLMGAAGIGPVFAILAFAGLVVALHESTRPGRRYALYLAGVNLALVILSGTRMAMIASAVFLMAYALLSHSLRTELRTRRLVSLGGVGALAFTGILYWPHFKQRMIEDGELALNLGREELWSFYYHEFLLSPVVGRGLGAGFLAGKDFLPGGLPSAHNEYLHLLVIGGGVGCLLIIAGVIAWYRELLRTASPNDCTCLIALIPALAVYLVTENFSYYTSALALYAYLGVFLTRPSPLLALPLAGNHTATPHDNAIPGISGSSGR